MTIRTEQGTIALDNVNTALTENDYTLEGERLPNNCAVVGILKGIEPEDKVSNVQNLVRPTSTTSNLIERLLQLSTFENHETLDAYNFFRLDDVIADAISLVSRVAIPRGVRIIFEPNDKAFVYAVKDMIYSMAQNLISNAISFSQKGETVTIFSKIIRDMVSVSISNPGARISKEKLLQLSQHQHFRINPGSTAPGIGEHEMDIGAEFSPWHRFVEKNDGQLSVTSENGQGIKFTFTLPTLA
jgi:two-component system, sensor histidine kinase and response regulator